MMKKMLSLCVATALMFSLSTTAFAVDGETEYFPQVNDFSGYSDVTESDWFYENTKLCYEVGLLTGTDTGFSPDDQMTGAQLMTLAARIHAATVGDTIDADTDLQWYTPYVTYLEEAELSTLDDPDAFATRADFIGLLAAVLSPEMLTPINQIDALPDTDDTQVLSFYNAGILTGTDDYGTFEGDKTLTRAEAAAMVSRIVQPDLRIAFVPATDEESFAVTNLTSEEVASDVDYALQLLGLPGDTICFSDQTYEITAQELLPFMIEDVTTLAEACFDEGYTFSMDLGFTYDTHTFYEYVVMYPVCEQVLIEWAQSQIPEVTLSPQAEEELAAIDPTIYLSRGIDLEQYRAIYYEAPARLQALESVYGDGLSDACVQAVSLVKEMEVNPLFLDLDLNTLYENLLAYDAQLFAE